MGRLETTAYVCTSQASHHRWHSGTFPSPQHTHPTDSRWNLEPHFPSMAVSTTVSAYMSSPVWGIDHDDASVIKGSTVAFTAASRGAGLAVGWPLAQASLQKDPSAFTEQWHFGASAFDLGGFAGVWSMASLCRTASNPLILGLSSFSGLFSERDGLFRVASMGRCRFVWFKTGICAGRSPAAAAGQVAAVFRCCVGWWLLKPLL